MAYIYHGMLRPFLKTYLYNGLIDQIPNGIISSMVYTIVCTSISILVAWASWSLYESQVLKLKSFFRY
jgi:hypothetical protein